MSQMYRIALEGIVIKLKNVWSSGTMCTCGLSSGSSRWVCSSGETTDPSAHTFFIASLLLSSDLWVKPRDTRASSLSCSISVPAWELLSLPSSSSSSSFFTNPEVEISKEAVNEPLRASVAIQMTVAVEQKSCSSSSGASRGSGDPTVRRITQNIWVCLNVCVNTPSGLMCSVEFWLHLGSTETHRQHRLRSNTHTHTHGQTHTHTRTHTHTIPLLVYLFFTSFSFVSHSFSHAIASGWHTTTDGLN